MSGTLRRLLALVSGLVAAVPNALLAWIYLGTWLDPVGLFPLGPESFGGVGMTFRLAHLLMLEFLVLHSTAFTGFILFDPKASRQTKLWVVFAFTLLYLLCAGGLSLAAGESWPLWMFAVLSLNRLLGALLGGRPGAEQAGRILGGWLISFLLFLVAVSVTAFLPVPALGMTEEALAVIDLPGEGIWVDHPERFLCAGLLYFGGVAVASLLVPVWVARVLEEQRRKTAEESARGAA